MLADGTEASSSPLLRWHAFRTMDKLKNRALPEYLAESVVCRYIAAKRFFGSFGKGQAHICL
jgi:hypothetical protein